MISKVICQTIKLHFGAWYSKFCCCTGLFGSITDFFFCCCIAEFFFFFWALYSNFVVIVRIDFGGFSSWALN